MPEYGNKEYWESRYSRVDVPFDWMVDYSTLAPTIEPLIPNKNASILIVGCGDAPFSADLYYIGGYLNQVNADYSEVVISKQKELWPEIDWRCLDCLDMKEIPDSSFDVVIDKSLIDTTMCYQEGTATTMKLYSELHRVLKPGGRLLTISLHKEDEVLKFGQACGFGVSSSCSLESERQTDVYHALCVFDKITGLDSLERLEVVSTHPIKFVNAVDPKALPQNKCSLSLSLDSSDDESLDYHFGFDSEDDLFYAFGKALDDTFIIG